jgi:hypothetical protein
MLELYKDGAWGAASSTLKHFHGINEEKKGCTRTCRRSDGPPWPRGRGCAHHCKTRQDWTVILNAFLLGLPRRIPGTSARISHTPHASHHTPQREKADNSRHFLFIAELISLQHLGRNSEQKMGNDFMHRSTYMAKKEEFCGGFVVESLGAAAGLRRRGRTRSCSRSNAHPWQLQCSVRNQTKTQ